MYRAEKLIYTIIEVIFSIIELLLAVRILLRFFGANPSTPFVSWLYDTTSGLIAPFAGIFPNPRLEGQFVIEISAVIALVVYAVIGAIILSFLADMASRTAARTEVREVRETRRR